MNKRKILTIIGITLFALSLNGCKKKSYCEKNGHDFINATCTEPEKCAECGEIGNKALGHDYSDATCVDDAICTRCDEIIEEALGHDYSDATCTTPATCKVCFETTGTVVKHDINVIRTEATCTENGSILEECKNCDYKVTTSINATGHNINVTTSNPTCTENGYTHEECLNCDYETEHIITAPGHDYSEATCKAPATCKNCGETKGETVEHSWKEATYSSPKKCSTCGQIELEGTLYNEYLSIEDHTTVYIFGYYDLSEFNVTVENPDIISIDEYGSIQALSLGTTNISFALKNGKSNTLTFSIEIISKMPDVFVTYDRLAIGEQTAFFFRNLDELVETSLNDFNIILEKGNILELQADNSLKALSLGTETITITSKFDDRITDSLTISVVDENEQLIVYGKDALNSLEAGDQFFMTTTLDYELTELEWMTTDPTVAVVSKDGLVSIVSEGHVTISAYDPRYPKDNTRKAKYSFFVEGYMNVDYISRLIHTALAENGTKETGSNVQKYGEWYGNNGQPWCAMFVSWCWNRCGLSTDLLLKYQGCTAGMQWCTEQGIMHYVQDFNWGTDLNDKVVVENYKPVAGDIIFFLSAGMGHTGIAIYSDDTYLYTIEGNTSDRVAIKRWTLTDARITGYATPKYPTYDGTPEDFSWIKEKQADGTYLWTNVSAQQKVD